MSDSIDVKMFEAVQKAMRLSAMQRCLQHCTVLVYRDAVMSSAA